MATQGQDAIPKIAPYLRDIDITVRLEAVKALDDIGGPKTVDALVEAARDNDPEIQIRATDGLVNVYLPGYLKTGISGSLEARRKFHPREVHRYQRPDYRRLRGSAASGDSGAGPAGARRRKPREPGQRGPRRSASCAARPPFPICSKRSIPRTTA